MNSPDKLLGRHYGTIGIEDVFLNPPSHPLLSSYLTKSISEESFESWEIVGTIKSKPEDFVVREIFQSDRKIPGLTDKDHNTLQIADLLGPDARPHQKLELNQQSSQSDASVNEEATKTNEAERMDKNITESLKKAEIESSHGLYALDISEEIQLKLKNLHDSAIARIHHVAKGQGQDTRELDGVWIKIPSLDTQELTTQRQTEMQRAIQSNFPHLQAETAQKDGSEEWVMAQVDTSSDGLIPYLQYPEEDLSRLLRFHKLGIRETDTSGSVVLRLQQNMTKERRKEFFGVFLAKFDSFTTTTINNYLSDASAGGEEASKSQATTAIVISWKKDESPRGILLSYMKKAARNREDANFDVISSLDHLNQIALDRLCNMSSNGNDTTNLENELVLIPPSSPDDPMSEAARLERGTVFQALKSEFPLLQLDSVTKNGAERWISVSVDTSYDELVQYLESPVDGIRALLHFQKQGLNRSEEKKRDQNNKGKQRKDGHWDGRKTMDEGNRVILKLRPGLSKIERKEVHHIVVSNCKLFETSTLTEKAPSSSKDNNDDKSAESATVSIAVGWQRHALQKGNRKRKRNEVKEGETDPSSMYPNLLCVIRKRQIEHLSMLHRMAQTIRYRQADIGLAGIKDMQAVTYQFCTFRDMKTHRILSRVVQLERQGIHLGNFYRVDWVLNNGDLDGNQFRICIRDIKRIKVSKTGTQNATESLTECQTSHVAEMAERIRQTGFINFFGPQRVGAPGESGATAFKIGQLMLQEDFKGAIDLLMMGRTTFHREGEQEGETARKVREIWKETGDPGAALDALGGGDLMPRERSVLKGLKRYGTDQPLQALQCLSHSMRTFWINAYQSYVWNQAASKRIAIYGPKVVKGDLYVEKDDHLMNNVKVIQDEALCTTISLDQLVLPLPGYRVCYPENEIGSIYENILRGDKVKFEKSALPEATAKGAYRRLIVLPGNIHAEVESDQTTNMILKFSLPKGSYATMLLREMMITTATRYNS